MDGFGLLVGHLLGDYILQNDWMAANKTNPCPGPQPGYVRGAEGGGFVFITGDANDYLLWSTRRKAWWMGHITCTIHCLLYTLAVWACSFWWMPWWGLVACFLIHWPIDRFRLAGRWMRTRLAGQSLFASAEHPLFPWSIIVVDNTIHLLTLFVIGVIARGFD